MILQEESLGNHVWHMTYWRVSCLSSSSSLLELGRVTGQNERCVERLREGDSAHTLVVETMAATIEKQQDVPDLSAVSEVTPGVAEVLDNAGVTESASMATLIDQKSFHKGIAISMWQNSGGENSNWGRFVERRGCCCDLWPTVMDRTAPPSGGGFWDRCATSARNALYSFHVYLLHTVRQHVSE
jgi:hypothetical protein